MTWTLTAQIALLMVLAAVLINTVAADLMEKRNK